MSFRLLIECTKDIDTLHIGFSDGTSSFVEKPKTPKDPKIDAPKKTKPKEYKEEYESQDENVDWNEYLQPINMEIVDLPSVPTVGDRGVNVAGEMKNAEF